jgi:acid stress chaperone HdeB
MAKLVMIALLFFLGIAPAKAQVTIEVSKITCAQYLNFTIADPRDIAIWLSGYYHGKAGSTVLEPQTLKQNADKLKSLCFRPVNANLPVMQAIDKALGK